MAIRTGIITEKVGMMRLLTEKGEHVPVTVLKLNKCQVTAVRTQEKHGYNAVQLGSGEVKPKNLSRPMKEYFAKAKISPKRKLVEFRVKEDGLLEVGDEIKADHFVLGQHVDVTAVSIGKGFAGAMKRYNFSGLRASHGVSLTHRSPGSTGQNQDPGRVFKGKKMAGHMGAKQVTMQNLKVVEIDVARGVIMVKGSVPGAKGTWVLIKDAVKKPSKELPYPASVKKMGNAIEANKAVEETRVTE